MSIRVHRSNDDGEMFVAFPTANGWTIHTDESMSVAQDGEVLATFARHCWSWVEDRDLTAPQAGAA